MKITLYAEEIEEAIMQYVVKNHNVSYDSLCTKSFIIKNAGYSSENNLLVYTTSDFKCAKVEIE